MTPRYSSRLGSAGFSLIELMVAAAIGMLLLAGLSLIFVNSSQANRELQKTAQQIENGRYAIDLLSQNLHHAGYYGHLYALPTPPGGLPDPCEIANLAVLNSALAMPVQGYRAANLATVADVTATTCDDKNLLPATNLRPGSDVLVIRRASTNVIAAGSNPRVNDVYIQATGTLVDVQFGTSAAITANSRIDGVTACLPYCKKTPPTPAVAAPIRKYMVHVYFVAPCSVGKGALDVCNGSSTEDTIPTLKRLELVSEGGVTKMKIIPLVEGVEYLKVEFGVDTIPATVNGSTGLAGDATADAYVDNYSATPPDWTTAIAAKVYVLARNTELTFGHTDTKTYTLGTVPVAGTTTLAATNDAFKRHAFAAAVRLINPAGRREIP